MQEGKYGPQCGPDGFAKSLTKLTYEKKTVGKK